MVDLRRQLSAAKASEVRAREIHVFGSDPGKGRAIFERAIARQKELEKALLQAERALGDGRSRADLKEKAFAALAALRERIENLSIRDKAEVLRVLIPGGPECRITVKKDGTMNMKGAIDFEKATAGIVTSDVSTYFS